MIMFTIGTRVDIQLYIFLSKELKENDVILDVAYWEDVIIMLRGKNTVTKRVSKLLQKLKLQIRSYLEGNKRLSPYN